MTYTFHPNDRAVVLPNPNTDERAQFWKLCTVKSSAVPMGILGCLMHVIAIDGSSDNWAIAPRWLMPLPKDGPDAVVKTKERDLVD